MGRLLQELHDASRPRYVRLGARLWAIARVDSDDLRRVGFASLEGSAAARAADLEVQAERDRQAALVEGAKGAKRSKAAAAARDSMRSQLDARFRAMLATPEGESAYLQRCDAYCLAAVRRVALARPDVQIPELVPLDPDTEPSAVAVDLRDDPTAGDPVYSEEVRLVAAEEDANPLAGRVWLGGLFTVEERVSLGTTIIKMLTASVIREVLPFRGRPGALPAGAPVGADVPGALAARGAPDGTVATGVRGEVHGTREGGGGGSGGDGDPGPGGRRRRVRAP